MVEFMSELFGGEMNELAKHVKVSDIGIADPDSACRQKKK
jgi:hypothetical protein